MKKLFIAATLSLALLPVAYAQTDATSAPAVEVEEYTPTPLDIFVEYLEAQSERDGLDASLMWDAIYSILYIEDNAELLAVYKMYDAIEDWTDAESEKVDKKYLNLYSKAIANRGMKELYAYAKEISTTVPLGAYDFSCLDMFSSSISVQSVKTGIAYEDIMTAVELIVYAEYKDILNAISDEEKRDNAKFKLSEKLIKGKTPAELVAIAKKLPRYDYSSMKTFENTFSSQANIYGYFDDDVKNAYLLILKLEYAEEFAKIEAIEDREVRDEKGLVILKEIIGEKSPKEIVDHATKLREELEGYQEQFTAELEKISDLKERMEALLKDEFDAGLKAEIEKLEKLDAELSAELKQINKELEETKGLDF